MQEYVVPVRGGEEERPAARARATVGGVEYAVGGWGEYEINRRHAAWETALGGDPPRAAGRYAGRSYVGAGDAVLSILGGAPPGPGGERAAVGGAAGPRGSGGSPLQRAALNLADTLSRLEDRLCDPDESGVWECVPASGLHGRALYLTVPPVTSADLRAFAADPAQRADPEALFSLGEDVTSLAAATGLDLAALPPLADRTSIPPLPSRVVPVSDEEGILRLEAATGPYVASVEALQAALATRLSAAAAGLAQALTRSGEHSMGKPPVAEGRK